MNVDSLNLMTLRSSEYNYNFFVDKSRVGVTACVKLETD